MNLLNSAASYLYGKKFQLTGPSLTFVRLCTSRHLRDLQQISSITFCLYVLLCLVVLIGVLGRLDNYKALAAVSALTSAAGVVLSWAYQTGSKRIGSVDLFSNEIAVICRVCLIVDFAQQSFLSIKNLDKNEIEKLSSEMEANRKNSFNSQEQYAPVYDKNVIELQPFDVDVIASVTQFYTYRKTMLDYLRRIAVADENIVRDLRIRMVYMQYLMYESAREAITLLVEFEPNRAEGIINVLCSEFTLFSLLRKEFEHDFRGDRLALRIAEYNTTMVELRRKMIENSTSPHWQRARTTYPELEKRYKSMCLSMNLPFMPEM